MDQMEVKEQRRKFIGGSDIAAVLGISPWKTTVDLWLDKTTPPMPEQDGKPARRVKTRGHRLEPYIIDMIEEEHELKITARNQRYIDPEVPFFACEIDAETQLVSMDGDTPSLPITENVEIKTVHPFKTKEWGEQDSDALPLHYLAQTQWQMGVTRRDRTHVFALIGDELKRYIVERDAVTIDAMRRRAEAFWMDYVVPGIRPPIDYTDSKALDTLKRLYPGTDGTAIQATAEHEHWRFVLEQAKDMAAKYERVVAGAEAHILAEMGNAAILVFKDDKAFTRKLIEVKGRTQVVESYSFIKFTLANIKPPKEKA